MPYIKVDREKCKGCMLCVNVCPKGLLKQGASLNRKGVKAVEFKVGEPRSVALPDPYKQRRRDLRPQLPAERGACTACCNCAVICPDSAIEVYK